jgi:serralysin
MTIASQYEVQMLALINADRAAYGLAPMRLNGKLNSSAETHSRWMLKDDVFSHGGSGGSDPGDRMRDAGYLFTGSWTWGENIAWQSERGAAGISDDVINLHNSLMNSPGHRANILNPDFVEIGIGIEVGSYETWPAVMVTQNFARSSANNGGAGTGFPVTESGETVDGTASADLINGLGGSDRINGLGGNDSLLGGTGNDLLSGGADNDRLDGEAGNDRLYGGTGNDLVYGGTGNDLLSGSDGADRLLGGSGNDSLSADAGNDQLFGGNGQDTLNGGADDDRLSGGTGADLLAGGAGADSFEFRPGDGSDRVTDFVNNEDTLVFAGGHWDGHMSVTAFVATYATLSGSTVTFDFGDGDLVKVSGITSLGQLYDDIQFLA